MEKIYVFMCFNNLFSNKWQKVWYDSKGLAEEGNELNDVEEFSIKNIKQPIKLMVCK